MGPHRRDWEQMLRTPLQLMTGLYTKRKILDTNPPLGPEIEKRISLNDAARIIEISKLQEALETLHKYVDINITERCKAEILKRNQMTNIVEPKFEISDLVLVRRAHDTGPRLQPRWTGPRCRR